MKFVKKKILKKFSKEGLLLGVVVLMPGLWSLWGSASFLVSLIYMLNFGPSRAT